MNTFVIYKNCICRGLNPACERCGGFCATEKVVVKEFNVKKSSRKAINSNEIVTTSNYPNCDYFFKKPELKKCQLCGKEHENFFRFSQKGVYCKFCKTIVPAKTYLKHIKKMHGISGKAFLWHSSHLHFYFPNLS